MCACATSALRCVRCVSALHNFPPHRHPRLPLRTTESAALSKIKDGKGGAPSFDEVLQTIVQPFLYQADAGGDPELVLHRRLLFLRFVQLIEVWVWEPNATAMKLVASASLAAEESATRSQQAERSSVMAFVKKKMELAMPLAHDDYGGPPGALRYFATMAGLDPDTVPRPLFSLLLQTGGTLLTGAAVEEQWLVSLAFGDRDDLSYAAAPRQRTEKLTLMPYAAVAALVGRREAGGEWAVAPPIIGRAYATLPLPISTGLPVHLNGRWEIASDRNSLAPDDALPRHEWNTRLAGRIGAAAYARLIRALATGFSLQIQLTDAQRGEVVNALMPPTDLTGVFGGAARHM